MKRSRIARRPFHLFHVLLLWSLHWTWTKANCQLFSSKTFSIDEEQPIGTRVGSLCRDPTSSYASLSLREFAIDPMGNISTRIVLDRENANQAIRYSFTATATNNVSTFFVLVSIDVLDVNDNAPRYPNDYVGLEIDEETRVGARFALSRALDADTGVNAQIAYSLVGLLNASDTFRLVADAFLVELVLVRPLDRERRDEYRFNMTATDRGVPPLSAVTYIDVNVTDANDNSPIFDKSNYSAVLFEDVPVRTSVVRVSATDADIGTNGRVVFAVRAGGGLFDVEPSSGVVFTLGSLDFEVQQEHEFEVVASNGGNRHETAVKIMVKLIDVNDNAPQVSIRFVDTVKYAEVPENLDPPELVAFVSVTDRDWSKRFRRHTLSLVARNYSSHFMLDQWDGHDAVTTSMRLDRESVALYRLIVTATDVDKPSLFTSSSFEVVVEDANDHAPQFSRHAYDFNITENSPLDASVGTVLASDLDSGTNAQLSYSVVSSSPVQAFSVSNTSGLIQVAGSLDREKFDEIILVVRVNDLGSPRRSATCTVNITILDVNDNRPVFRDKVYRVRVSEAAPIGFHVVSLHASDADDGMNGQVKYALASTSPSPGVGYFRVGADGSLRTTRLLDRETVANFTLVVEASDLGVPEKTSRAAVQIDVLDVNDNRPIFDQFTYFAALVENNRPGVPLCTVTATDLDFGVNGSVTYFLDSRTVNGSSLFSVDRSSGNVSALASFDREFRSSYEIYVGAEDGGGLTSVVPAKVELTITDVNDNPPEFLQKSYTFFVVETASLNTSVGSVAAVSKDQGINAKLVYYQLQRNASTPFNVTESGEIILIRSLGGSLIKEYVFYVVAEDTSPIPLSTSVKVTVEVTVVNKEGPVFHSAKASVTVREDALVGDRVFTASASDSDTGTSGQVRYHILDSNLGFSINETTGDVTLNRPLDYETARSVDLIVAAVDRGFPPRTASMNLTVDVSDVNDNAPTFSEGKDVLTLRISEGVAPPHPFYRFRVFDRDSGVNGRVTLSLSGSSAYSLLPGGDLTVSKPLDRETIDAYNLTVLAVDGGVPQLNSTLAVRIVVLDVNDNSPQFLSKSFNFSLREHTANGTVLGRTGAVDKDIGSNAVLTYVIQSGAGAQYFEIDSKTGDVLVKRPIDFETLMATRSSSLVSFSVLVHDIDTAQHQDFAQVNVEVIDVNDNRPSFLKSTYTGYVQENSLEALVMTVGAIDEDMGTNGMIHYALPSDQKSIFRINSTTGELYTRSPLDREKQAMYKFNVSAIDGGVPALRSDVPLTVYVSDVNDWAPELLLSQTNLTVHVSEDTSLGKVVGKVTFFDKDAGLNSLLRYEITNSTANLTFLINQATGELILAKRLKYEDESQSFLIEVTAYDSGNPPMSGSAIISVVVTQKDNTPLLSSVVVTVYNVTRDRFVSHYVAGFIRSVSTILSASVEILSLGSAAKRDLDVLVAARNSSGQYIARDDWASMIRTNEVAIEQSSGLTIIKVDADLCSSSPCLNGATCQYGIDFELAAMSIGGFSYHPFSHYYRCDCSVGFSGSRCETDIDECQSSPCQNNGSCSDFKGGFRCSCAFGFTGQTCDQQIDFCRSLPCLNGGSCLSLSGSYECQCMSGYLGVNCDIVVYTFDASSSVTYVVSNAASDVEVLFDFSTVLSSGLILTLGNGTEFIALQLARSKLAVQDGNASSTFDKDVSDGSWHHVQLHLYQMSYEVALDHCPVGDNKCRLTRSYSTRALLTNLIVIAGSSPVVREGIIFNYYVGSLRALYVNHNRLDLQSAEHSQRVQQGRPVSSCKSSSCINGGSCLDLWTKSVCLCKDSFSGIDCSHKEKPTYHSDGAGYLEVNLADGYALFLDHILNARSPVRKRRAALVSASQTVSFRFRIRRPESVLLVVGQSELKLEDGFLTLSTTTLKKKTNVYLADGAWHEIAISESLLSLNDTYVLNVSSFLLNGRAESILIGGTNGSGLHGCVADVMVSGLNVPNGIASLVRRGRVSPCPSGSSCDTSSSSNVSFSCQCPFGYFLNGPKCEQSAGCFEAECDNGGTCYDDGNAESVSCVCAPGFTGPTCQLRLPVCSDSTCKNGGTCSVESSATTCKCLSGFTGTECEETFPSQDNSSLVAGIAVLVTLLVLLLVGIVFFIWYRHSHRRIYKVTTGQKQKSTISSVELVKSTSDKNPHETKLEATNFTAVSTDTNVDEISAPPPYPASTTSRSTKNSKGSKGSSKGSGGKRTPKLDKVKRAEVDGAEKEKPKKAPVVKVATVVTRPCDSPVLDHAAQIPPGMEIDLSSETGASSFVDEGMIVPPIEMDSISDVIRLQCLSEYEQLSAPSLVRPYPGAHFRAPTDGGPPRSYRRRTLLANRAGAADAESLPNSLRELVKAPMRTISQEDIDSTSEVNMPRPGRSTVEEAKAEASLDSAKSVSGSSKQGSQVPRARGVESDQSSETTLVMQGELDVIFHDDEARVSDGETSVAPLGLSQLEMELLQPLPTLDSLEDLKQIDDGRRDGDGFSSDVSDSKAFGRGNLGGARSATRLSQAVKGGGGIAGSKSAPALYHPRSRGSLDTVSTLNSDSVTDSNAHVLAKPPDGAEVPFRHPAVCLDLDLDQLPDTNEPHEDFV